MSQGNLSIINTTRCVTICESDHNETSMVNKLYIQLLSGQQTLSTENNSKSYFSLQEVMMSTLAP